MSEYFKKSYKAEALSLPLVIKNVGYQHCTPGYRWGPGMRDHYLIHYVVSGHGVYTVCGKTYRVCPNQVFLAVPNTVVSYTADEGEPWEYYWLGFSGPDAAALAAQAGADVCPVMSIDFGSKFQHYITAIYEARGQAAWNRTQMLGYAYLLLGKLIEGKTETPSASDMVERAAEFVENNYADQITVDDIAASVNASRSWLYRSFVSRFGKSPNAYLRDKRIDYAKYLLTNTRLRVTEIACSVGYLDPLYFSKVFSRTTGRSPTEYRAATVPKTEEPARGLALE